MLKSNLESRTTLKCFWCDHLAVLLLLKMTGGYETVFDFRKKIASFACFSGSVLNCIFHKKVQLLIEFKSAFRVFSEFTVLITFGKSEVLSAKVLNIDKITSRKSFMYISRVKLDLILTPVAHQSLFFSKMKFDHLSQLFVLDL